MREVAPRGLIDSTPMRRRQVLAGMAGLAGASIAAPTLAQIAPTGLDLIAFVAGIDSYRYLRPLRRAVSDAQAVASRLNQYGYRLHPTDDPSRSAFYDALNPFLEELTPNSAAFIYLSGHGVQVARRNYLLPADVPRTGDEGFMTSAISLDAIMTEIAAAGPAQTIVILDACRDGATQLSVPAFEQGYASSYAQGNFFIAYSAGVGEFALDSLGDDDPSPNGLFTRHFLEEMAPDVAIYDIVLATRAKVTPAAREAGHFQHPAIYDQATWPYRLDGKELGGARRRVKAPGSLAGTAVVIAATQEYPQPYRLATPRLDAERLGRAFEALGAEVTMLLEPDKTRLLEICRALGKRGHRKLAFYWTGMGGAINAHACCLVGAMAPAGAEDGPMPGYMLEVVSEADIIAAFRAGESERPAPSGETRGFRIMTVPPKTSLFLFFDACLHDLGSLFPVEDFNTAPTLAEIQQGEANNTAVLAASSYFQSAWDAAEETTSSPFAIAMLNALAIPGLSMAQLAYKVRDEVEALTDRKQTPSLFAGPEIERQVFVDLE